VQLDGLGSKRALSFSLDVDTVNSWS